MLKPTNIISCTAIGAFFLLAGNASADLYTIEDSWIDWPGYTSAYSTDDDLTNPEVQKMELTIEGELLKSIDIFMTTDIRVQFDSLFLNTSYTDGDSWDDWDYFVHDDGGTEIPETATVIGAIPEDGFYSVADDYVYTFADVGGRAGTPDGIDAGSLTLIQAFTPTFDTTYGMTNDGYESILTYDFTSFNDGNGLAIENGIFVAYAPYCANDVIGGGVAPVPEPATMLLFGTGLIGLAGQRLRRKKK